MTRCRNLHSTPRGKNADGSKQCETPELKSNHEKKSAGSLNCADSSSLKAEKPGTSNNDSTIRDSSFVKDGAPSFVLDIPNSGASIEELIGLPNSEDSYIRDVTVPDGCMKAIQMSSPQKFHVSLSEVEFQPNLDRFCTHSKGSQIRSPNETTGLQPPVFLKNGQNMEVELLLSDVSSDQPSLEEMASEPILNPATPSALNANTSRSSSLKSGTGASKQSKQATTSETPKSLQKQAKFLPLSSPSTKNPMANRIGRKKQNKLSATRTTLAIPPAGVKSEINPSISPTSDPERCVSEDSANAENSNLENSNASQTTPKSSTVHPAPPTAESRPNLSSDGSGDISIGNYSLQDPDFVASHVKTPDVPSYIKRSSSRRFVCIKPDDSSFPQTDNIALIDKEYVKDVLAWSGNLDLVPEELRGKRIFFKTPFDASIVYSFYAKEVKRINNLAVRKPQKFESGTDIAMARGFRTKKQALRELFTSSQLSCRTFSCTRECGRFFDNALTYIQHYSYHHLRDTPDSKLWPCVYDDCVFSIIGFQSTADVLRHIRSSHGLRKPICIFCKIHCADFECVYSRLDSLKRHIFNAHTIEDNPPPSEDPPSQKPRASKRKRKTPPRKAANSKSKIKTEPKT